jgi:hypothetical protein
MRHRAAHLPKALSEALRREEDHSAGDLIALLRKNIMRVERMGAWLESQGWLDEKMRRDLIGASRAMGSLVPILGQMRGDIEPTPTTVVNQVVQVVYDSGGGQPWRPPARLPEVTDGEEVDR